MKTRAKEAIGLTGLMTMGRPMSKNFNYAGYPLVVHDIVREPVPESLELEAR